MNRFARLALLIAAIVAVDAVRSDAAFMTFTDEASYLAAISGRTTITEGFESSAWDPTRGAGVPGTIESQGVTWSSSENLRTIGPPSIWVRSGDWGAFDSYGDPDIIYAVSSSETLYGFGGWFASTTAPSINFLVDGAVLAVGPSLGTTHSFFGVVDTDGFSAVSIGSSGHWGADDFTIAFANVVPTPSSMALLGIGAASLLGFRKRRKTELAA